MARESLQLKLRWVEYAQGTVKGLLTNIREAASTNTTFRTVLYTATHCQLVVMSLKAGEDIGEEVHALDQFIRCEQGAGVAAMNSVTHVLSAGMAVLVPAGIRHNIRNTSTSEVMRLSTLYSPPNHRGGVVHKTKVEALADTEHFDGKTSE